MNVDYSAIGQRIKRSRRARGMTQEHLAEALTVSVGYISQIERGVTKISLDTLAAVATRRAGHRRRRVPGALPGPGAGPAGPPYGWAAAASAL